MTLDIGICFHREEAPATVVQRAVDAERLGFDEFWVIEDCFFTAGVSLAATALNATDAIGVGIGIAPAVARNPAITAMEFATLAELAPGRFHGGIGHGVQSWMAQMGELRASPLTALEETLAAVRGLLAGDEMTVSGRYVQFDKVALDSPPSLPPLVSAGVRGPKSLELAGRAADGVILADFCSPSYLAFVHDHVARGNPDNRPHRTTVFCSAAVSDDGDEAREAMSYHLADVAPEAHTSLIRASFWDRLTREAETKGWLGAVQAMPAEWWCEIAAVGTPEEAAAYLQSLETAGADAVALFPSPFEPIDDTQYLAETLLARFQS